MPLTRVSGDASPLRVSRRRPDRGDRSVADRLGAPAVRQVHQRHAASGAFDQGTDGRGVVLADDQIAFPVAGHRPVLGLCGTTADHHHGVAEAGPALLGPATGLAPPAAGAQSLGRLSAQFTPALDAESPADGLVDHVPLRPLLKPCCMSWECASRSRSSFLDP
ncbi:hypothetical protein GCM10020295_21190 [Streptomyces cinereospinus]